MYLSRIYIQNDDQTKLIANTKFTSSHFLPKEKISGHQLSGIYVPEQKLAK